MWEWPTIVGVLGDTWRGTTIDAERERDKMKGTVPHSGPINRSALLLEEIKDNMMMHVKYIHDLCSLLDHIPS
jgi:hypothetical protein